MPEQDKALSLSLTYLDAIQKRLNIGNQPGTMRPQFLRLLSPQAINRLQDDLTSILSGSPSQDAISATCAFGEKHIQMVGYGLADELDRLVKLGFLCGERVVLWDILSSRLLKSGIGSPASKATFKQAVTSLVALRPVVEQGGRGDFATPDVMERCSRIGRCRPTQARQ